MSSNDPIVSTGRGGAGNIGHDPNVYTDGAIVREGIQGESSEPEYSTGTPRLGERNWGTYKSPNDQVREDDYKEHSSTPPPSQPLEQHLLKPRKTTTNKHPQRGGAGNISTPRHGTPDPTSHSHAPHAPHLTSAHAPSSGRSSTDVIPEPALRNPGPEYANFHTGRGGEGNVHRAEFGGHSGPQKEHKHHEGEGEGKKAGLGEKVKHLLHMDGHGKEKKEKEASREGTPGA